MDEENEKARKEFEEELMRQVGMGAEGRSWRKLVLTDPHEAGHAFLIENADKLGLFRPEGLAIDAMDAPIMEGPGVKAFEPTSFGHILAALTCGLASGFAARMAAGGPAGPLVRDMLMRAIICGVRLGIAKERGDLDEWFGAITPGLDVFAKWIVANTNEEEEEGDNEKES